MGEAETGLKLTGNNCIQGETMMYIQHTIEGAIGWYATILISYLKVPLAVVKSSRASEHP